MNNETQSFEPYFVTVTVPALNVRVGPGITNKVLSVIGKDQTRYRVTKEVIGHGDSTWCKLSTLGGWVDKKYTKPVCELG